MRQPRASPRRPWAPFLFYDTHCLAARESASQSSPYILPLPRRPSCAACFLAACSKARAGARKGCPQTRLILPLPHCGNRCSGWAPPSSQCMHPEAPRQASTSERARSRSHRAPSALLPCQSGCRPRPPGPCGRPPPRLSSPTPPPPGASRRRHLRPVSRLAGWGVPNSRRCPLPSQPFPAPVLPLLPPPPPAALRWFARAWPGHGLRAAGSSTKGRARRAMRGCGRRDPWAVRPGRGPALETSLPPLLHTQAQWGEGGRGAPALGGLRAHVGATQTGSLPKV
jgi:hypothetical protein